jgi:hypothetical protein
MKEDLTGREGMGWEKGLDGKGGDGTGEWAIAGRVNHTATIETDSTSSLTTHNRSPSGIITLSRDDGIMVLRTGGQERLKQL